VDAGESEAGEEMQRKGLFAKVGACLPLRVGQDRIQEFWLRPWKWGQVVSHVPGLGGPMSRAERQRLRVPCGTHHCFNWTNTFYKVFLYFCL
jgi:hypothetical protein